MTKDQIHIHSTAQWQSWPQWWLALVAASIIVMMGVGAATRLTESGLSMVEWKPLLGWIPPLSEAEWQRIFALYQQTSQYQLMNSHFRLTDFQEIFWWEYFHRLLGRVIGLIYGLPLLYLIWRKAIPPCKTKALVMILALGGLQGVVGWWMVVSGLVDRTEVSPYRLAIHLGLALLVLMLVSWQAFGWHNLTKPTNHQQDKSAKLWGWLVTLVIFLTIMMGALTAGSRAGFIYNEWPLMDGAWFPAVIFENGAGWLSFFTEQAGIQMGHRLMAYATLLIIVITYLKQSSHHAKLKKWAGIMLGLALLQIILGVMTLLTVVHHGLAVMHQLNAAFLLLASLYFNWWQHHRT